MKPSDFRYKRSYKTAMQRALYLLAIKHCGSLSSMASSICALRQYFSEWMRKGTVPTQYAGLLARTFDFDPGLLCHQELVIIYGSQAPDYAELVKKEFTNTDDVKYILAGTYIKSPDFYAKLFDKDISCQGKKNVSKR